MAFTDLRLLTRGDRQQIAANHKGIQLIKASE